MVLSNSKKFEFLEHTADVKFRVYGKSLRHIFSNCALAISQIISRGKKIKAVKKKEFSVSGRDYEAMLYNFVDELIYLLDAESFVVSRADVSFDEDKVNVTVYGDDASRYNDLDAIKSATYAEMYVREAGKGNWEAQVVVD